jgi:hypothetical protein
LNNDSGGQLNNTGRLNNQYADLSNADTAIIEAGGQVDGTGSFAQTAGSTTVNGTLSQSTVDIQGGLLAGGGTVATTGGFTVGVGGVLSPGDSLGTLTVVGSLALKAPCPRKSPAPWRAATTCWTCMGSSASVWTASSTSTWPGWRAHPAAGRQPRLAVLMRSMTSR